MLDVYAAAMRLLDDSIPKYFEQLFFFFSHQKHLDENAKITYTQPILTTVPSWRNGYYQLR